LWPFKTNKISESGEGKMTNQPAQTPVTIDTNLSRQTCGKLYAHDDKGGIQLTGQWCFQFSEEENETMEVLVSMSGSSSMAVAMGTPMRNLGKLNKESVTQLRNWLTDILQQMNQKEDDKQN